MKLKMIQLKTQTEWTSLWSQIHITLQRDEIKEQQQKILDLTRADEKALEQALTDKSPQVRLTAVQVISQRRLHLERDLIERLLDEQPLIRMAANKALVRLT